MTYRVAVAVSGRGSNLSALITSLSAGHDARIVLVLSDRAAPALALAASRQIPTHQLADYRSPAEWLDCLSKSGADLLVLGGYLRLIPAPVVAAWRGRIINIHPALLPRHGGPGMYGLRVHQAVLDQGDLESGATVHTIDEQYDRGEILAQGRLRVLPGDDAHSLAARVLALEHQLLPQAVLAAARAGHPVAFTPQLNPATKIQS